MFATNESYGVTYEFPTLINLDRDVFLRQSLPLSMGACERQGPDMGDNERVKGRLCLLAHLSSRDMSVRSFVVVALPLFNISLRKREMLIVL